MRIKLTKDRKVLAIATDEFTLTLNGRSNAEYKAMLAPLGIILEFEAENPAAVAQELLDNPSKLGYVEELEKIREESQ